MKTQYQVSATNIYALASTLIKHRIPFEFVPTKAYGVKERTNSYNRSFIRFALNDKGMSIDFLKEDMTIKYGDTFGFTILKENKFYE